MGWHSILHQRVLDLEAGKKIPRPEGATLMLETPDGKDGTDNFKMMAGAGWLRWSALWGKPADEAAALARCNQLISWQVGPSGPGFMLGEQLAGDPHFNYHAWPVFSMRQTAIASTKVLALSPGVRSCYAKLKDLTGAWIRCFRVISNALRGVDHRPRPLLWLSGMRCEGGPLSQVADDTDRATRGVPLAFPKELAEPGFHAVRLAKELLAAGDDLGGSQVAGVRPRLKVPVNVARAGSRIQVWMDKPKGVGDTSALGDGHNSSIAGMIEPCDWIDGDVESGVFTFGKFWKTPRPALPQGATVVTLGR